MCHRADCVVTFAVGIFKGEKLLQSGGCTQRTSLREMACIREDKKYVTEYLKYSMYVVVVVLAGAGICEVFLFLQLQVVMGWANQQCEKESYYYY